MSEPIRNKRADQAIAPYVFLPPSNTQAMSTLAANHHPVLSTPQNTPANAAPISSRAQQPGVASIKEGEQSPACKASKHVVVALRGPVEAPSAVA